MTTMMKSVFIIFITLMVAIHADIRKQPPTEWGNLESCHISQECQTEIKDYKECLKGLDRKSRDGPIGGPCITCPDLSRCCCATDRITPDFQGTCDISQRCLLVIDSYNENCQEQDRNQMVDSSLGCANGSRCWCFMQ